MQVTKVAVFICNFVFYGRYIGDYVDPARKFSMAITNGKDRFFLGTKNASLTQLYYVSDICFGVFELSLQLAFYWNSYLLTTFLCGVLPLTFFVSVKTFQSQISSEVVVYADGECSRSKVSFQQNVGNQYEKLRCLTDSINGLWCRTAFFWVLETTTRMIFVYDAVSVKDTLRLINYIE